MKGKAGRMCRRAFAISLATRTFFLASAVAVAQDPPANDAPSPDNRPKVLQDVRIDQRLSEQVPGDLVFSDETGGEVHLSDYFGKRPVVLVLVYYRCPMVCPTVLNTLAGTLRDVPLEPGNDYTILTVSFDPTDTPAASKKKKEEYAGLLGKSGADEGWHFLTGTRESIEQLTEAVGFHYVYQEQYKQYAHPAGVIILTPDGKTSRYFLRQTYSPRDLRLGLVEAAQGRIGSPVDQVLLYCFHYDPEMGRYTASVMNLLRAGGIVTLLAIGSIVWLSWRHERRKARAKPAAGE